MKWTYHHDPAGIPDYREQLPFNICIEHYWTNDEDVRIGYFGWAKGIFLFTYKENELNFRFKIHRGFGDGTTHLREVDDPLCRLYIQDSLPNSLGAKGVSDVIDTIKDFLFIYRNPAYPNSRLIKEVAVPFADKYQRSAVGNEDV